MSTEPYKSDLEPASPSRTFRSKIKVTTAPQKRTSDSPVVPEALVTGPSFSEPAAAEPPHAEPSAPELFYPEPSAPELFYPEASAPGPLAVTPAPEEAVSEPEPYSPFRVPPTRKLPDMVFSNPASSAEAQNSKSRSARSILLPLLAVAGVAAIIAIGLGALSQVTEGNLLQGELNRSAQVGQCYSDQIRFVDCSTGHTYEVYGTNQLPQRDDYPGLLKRSLGSESCEFLFFNYVGMELAGSSFSIYSVYPSEGQWADGERWEICVLSDASLNQLAGSSAGISS